MSWAWRAAEDLDEELGEDRLLRLRRGRWNGLCRGHPVPRTAFKDLLGRSGWRKTSDIDPYNDLFCDLLEENRRSHTPGIRETAATGSTGRCRTPTAVCPSSPPAGATDTIPSTSAATQKARSAVYISGLSTSKATMKSRSENIYGKKNRRRVADSPAAAESPGTDPRCDGISEL